MKELVANFTTQLREALSIGQNYKFVAPKKEFKNIVLTGLGGSGIGGSIAQSFAASRVKIPFIVNKDYFLPAFVDSDTLVIVSSYSGNTEETLSALKDAMKAKATIVCVTSGGKLAEIAKKNGFDAIIVPGGMPPRACLGYSLIQSLYIMHGLGLLKNDFEKSINAAIKLLDAEESNIQKAAKALAKKLQGTTPIVYAASDMEAIAMRFRQQINENSKMLCWHQSIPEMNHNELVGWRTKDNSRAVVIIRNDNDFKRTQLRMEINKDVIKKYTKNITEIWSQGKTYWEKVFYIVHLTDWASVYLAELNGMDPVEIKVIEHLKGALAGK